MIETLVRDLIYSGRRLGKQPGVTAIAVLSIGLGIGANATIFSMINRVLLRPAPVGDPSTLLAFYTAHRGDLSNNVSWPLYNDLCDNTKSFSGIAAYDELLPASINGDGEPERVWGQAVTTNYFSVTELRMIRGRGFVNREENAPVVVLGAGLWQRRFNSDPSIVGKTVTLSGHLFTVVGVAPASFHSVDQLLDTQFWVPLGSAAQLASHLPDLSDRNFQWLAVVGRLRPGVTRTQALAELNALARRIALSYSKTDEDKTFLLVQAGSFPGWTLNVVMIFLATLSVVVLFVLVIAGANVANLLFAQAAGRQHELAVRLALGATRRQLQRQMLMESGLLGLGGGVLGVLLSLWATGAISALHLPVPVPVYVSIRVDWRVLLFTFVLSVVSGLLLGIAPAWTATRPLLANALRGEDALARPGRRFTLRNVLIVAQIAMSVVLLSMTGLFLRSLQSATRIDVGIQTKGVLMLSVDPREHGYTAERTAGILAELQKRVTALPGVVSTAYTDHTILTIGGPSDSFQVDGRQDRGTSTPDVDISMVTPGYFGTLDIPLIAGRDFGGEAANGPKTAVVNRAFAERAFGSEYPIGRHVSGGGEHYEIVGVVGNVKSHSLGEAIQPVLYRSLQQNITNEPSFNGFTLVVHTVGDPVAMQKSLRHEIHALDPTMAVFNEETMEEHVSTAFFLPRLAATLFGVFGGIGLVLAVVGLYGVMSYAVSQRTREIGVRMAIGAQPNTVERLVLRQGLVLTLIGVTLGWPAAWMLARLSASSLYGIHPHDVLTFAVAPLFLIASALAACWIPARRAASINPMQALRME